MMENVLIFLGIVLILFLGYCLWLRFFMPHSFQPILERFRHRIQSKLRVAGVKELKDIQEDLIRLERQMQIFLAHSKPAANNPHILQKDHQEKNLSLVQVAPPEKFPSPLNLPFPRPRSIVRNGLRFTLSDALWIQLENMSCDKLDDDQLHSMLQGPFCRECLKRLVGRDPTAEIPDHCRHCGTNWSSKRSEDLPISLMDLKRLVYISLNQEFQRSRRIPG